MRAAARLPASWIPVHKHLLPDAATVGRSLNLSLPRLPYAYNCLLQKLTRTLIDPFLCQCPVVLYCPMRKSICHLPPHILLPLALNFQTCDIQSITSGIIELLRTWTRLVWKEMLPMCKLLPANVQGTREAGSVPGLGRSPGEGNGNPLQYSCLENPMDRGAWWATVHAVIKGQRALSDWACTHTYVRNSHTGAWSFSRKKII